MVEKKVAFSTNGAGTTGHLHERKNKRIKIQTLWASQVVLVVKNPPVNADARAGSIHGLGRSLGGGHDNPLQYSCGEFHGQRSLAGCLPSIGLQRLGHD